MPREFGRAPGAAVALRLGPASNCWGLFFWVAASCAVRGLFNVTAYVRVRVRCVVLCSVWRLLCVPAVLSPTHRALCVLVRARGGGGGLLTRAYCRVVAAFAVGRVKLVLCEEEGKKREDVIFIMCRQQQRNVPVDPQEQADIFASTGANDVCVFAQWR